ncbi:uncharacterized protein [Antedon mediterranea]|uniref:uncharacterized protein n=1 Tax=Antedon mediterranea TaxID=105859 RepID=UPI003AF6BF9C
MVKKLKDLCLQCISRNLHTISQVGKLLPTQHKEALLRRLVDHDMLTLDYLPYVTYHLFSPAIKKICFNRCPQISDSVLIQLDLCLCRLENITINICTQVTDTGIEVLMSKQTELVVLKLINLPHLTCKGLQTINSKKLRQVDLHNCGNIGDKGIQSLVTKNTNIRVLNLENCYKLTEEIIPDIANCLNENLEELNLGCLNTLSDNGLSLLANRCKNLRRLCLHGCNRITGECMLQLFSNCSNLQDLDLSFCYRILDDPYQDVLEYLPQSITSLSLGGLQTDGDMLHNALARLPNIYDLKLCGVNSLNETHVEKIFGCIGDKLIKLDLSGCNQSACDSTLKTIVKYCINLEELALAFCMRITGEPLLKLLADSKRAESLRSIRLSGCRDIQYHVLVAIVTSCPNLEGLYMAGLKVLDDAMLHTIANNCHKLKEISLKSCIANTNQVSDSGLTELARCCPLKEVVLSGVHSLTNKSVLALANNCPDLKCLYISGCSKVSSAAVRYLQDVCNRRVFVEHRVPNADPNQIIAKNLDTGEYCHVDII